MLLTCPECKLQVSDKALTCPHCGFPIQKSSAPVPRKKHKHRRLPNGFGQITEIKNRNLRKPFRAMVTAGKNPDGSCIVRPLRPEAYFETYNDAYQALLKYNRHAFDLSNQTTMQDLYEEWVAARKAKVDPSTLARYKTAWAYSAQLHSMLVRDVKISDMRRCIETGTILYAGKPRHPENNAKESMKTLYNLLFDYAVSYELVDKNYARMFHIDSGYVRKPNRHMAYTDEELGILWNSIDKHPIVDMILIQCYSGWRPGEMCDIEMKNVDLENRTIRGGLKTKAGINRIVPIHPRIFELVKARYEKSLAAGSPYLFYRICRGKLSKIQYANYQMDLTKEVIPLLSLNPDHKGHDGRVTFVTLAKRYNVNEYALKRIVGHAIQDLTERVYTERSVEWLQEEIEKIP